MCASTSFVANIDGRKIDETHCTLTRLNVVLSSDESHCGCWSGHEEGCGGHDCATAPHITAPHTIVIIATAGRASGCAQIDDIIPGSTFPTITTHPAEDRGAWQRESRAGQQTSTDEQVPDSRTAQREQSI